MEGMHVKHLDRLHLLPQQQSESGFCCCDLFRAGSLLASYAVSVSKS